MPKIYGFTSASEGHYGDIAGYALAEDGTVLASHISSNEWFLKHDLGMDESGDNLKHDKYKTHYPDGFELEYVFRKDRDAHQGLKAALEKNHSKE